MASIKEKMVEELICSAKKKTRDLVINKLKLGGKEPVRDLIILTPKDVSKKKEGKNVFTLSYCLGNEGYLSCKDFENIAYFNDKVVAKQQSLSVGPNDSKIIKDEVALDIKDGNFLVRVDAFSRITEDDETNNDISCKIVFKGFQGAGSGNPELHIEMLRISGRPPVRGQMKLTERDSKGKQKDRYGFAVEYVIRNYGSKDATEFDNLFMMDGKSFCRQPKFSLKAGESKLVEGIVYFPIRNGKLTIRLDGENKYPKAQGCNQLIEAQLMFQGFKV